MSAETVVEIVCHAHIAALGLHLTLQNTNVAEFHFWFAGLPSRSLSSDFSATGSSSAATTFNEARLRPKSGLRRGSLRSRCARTKTGGGGS